MARLSFELSPNQIAIRNVLSNKNFIEVDIYAISNADPNRNHSCFTLTSMESGIHTFTDKPILGFFNQFGDFEQHNGQMGYDNELDVGYWDNSEGEQILGFIREKDRKEIVEKDGLSWIRCTAMICTQYNFKQVKRLLKDRKKKVSVEVEILKSEVINGIQYIYEFELLGITILGSKGGVPIREGIEGAHLSVLDLLDKEPLYQQRQALAFAYAELNKEEDMQVAKEDMSTEEVSEVTAFAEEVSKTDGSEMTPEDDGAKFCDNFQDDEEEKKPDTDKDDDEGEGAAEDDSSDDETESKKDMAEDVEETEVQQECDWKAHCDELQMQCDNYEKRCAEYGERCGGYESRCAEYEERCSAYEANYNELKAECDKYRAELESLQAQAKEKVKQEQLCHLDRMAQKMGLSKEEVKDVTEKCCNFAFNSVDEIDKEVAYIAWKKNYTVNDEHFSVDIVEQKKEDAIQPRAQLSVQERLKKNIKK